MAATLAALPAFYPGGPGLEMQGRSGSAEALHERRHYAARTMPKLRPTSLALSPSLLRSALFRPASGPRGYNVDYVPVASASGCVIEHAGRELRQDDERVLLALVHAAQGRSVTQRLSFKPRAFCVSIGWPDSGESVAKLKACLERLHSARIRLRFSTGLEGSVHLLGDYTTTTARGGAWSVEVSQSLCTLLHEHGRTFVPLSQRYQLRDGLASWLLGLLSADAGWVPYSWAELRRLSGSENYEQREFNRRCRAALKELQDLGLCANYQPGPAGLSCR